MFKNKESQATKSRGNFGKLKEQSLHEKKMCSGNHDLFLNKMKNNDPTFDQ